MRPTPKAKELKHAERELKKRPFRKSETSLHLAMEWLKNMSPDQIATLCTDRNVTGRQGTTHHCPLANLFKSEFGGQFIIGRKWIYRRSGKYLVREKCLDNLATFIRKFDISGYPGLIAPPPRVLAQKIKDTRKGNRHKQPEKRYPRSPKINHPSAEASRWIV